MEKREGLLRIMNEMGQGFFTGDSAEEKTEKIQRLYRYTLEAYLEILRERAQDWEGMNALATQAASRTVAVGISSHPACFSNTFWEELIRSIYDLVDDTPKVEGKENALSVIDGARVEVDTIRLYAEEDDTAQSVRAKIVWP